MSASQRRKGARGELESADAWSEILRTPMKRRLGQARDSGHDLDGVESLTIEVKRVKSLKTLYRWYGQAYRATIKRVRDRLPYRSVTEVEIPIAVVDLRADNEPALIVIRRDDVVEFVDAVNRARFR